MKLLEPIRHRFSVLECTHCGHWYVIDINPAKNAEYAFGPSFDFRSEWFQFTPSAFSGPTSLNCPRCETNATPAVSHLYEP
jgi:hypothetical protein